jgi:hypothetical protein
MPQLPPLNLRQRIHALVWVRRGLLWVLLPWAVWGLAQRQWGWLLVLGMGMLLRAALASMEQSLRRQFIRDAELPRFLTTHILAAHPGLQARDAELVLRGLRQFFMAYLRSGRQFVGMPSKVVDTAWHAYILHTQGYARWCQTAFGGMLHHTPAEEMGHSQKHNNGLRRTWFWTCKEESIHPRQPSRLPLLFALDAKFGIQGGYRYTPDCKDIDRQSDAGAYCGADFGGSDGSSSGGDFGGSDSSSDGGGADGGGCGGGGD